MQNFTTQKGLAQASSYFISFAKGRIFIIPLRGVAEGTLQGP